MANKWITFLTKWAKDNNVNYRDAMKSPKAKADYNKSKGGEEVKNAKAPAKPKAKPKAKPTAKSAPI